MTRTSRESACILSANSASEGERVKAHEEGDENRGVHHEERAECCPAVAQSVGHRTSEKDTDERTATVLVRPGKALGLRHRASGSAAGPEGWERIEIGFGRLDPLVDELLGYGPDVVVEQPRELRVAVVDRLRAATGAA